MKTAWEPVWRVLPPGLRTRLEKVDVTNVRELRFRVGQPLELNQGKNYMTLDIPTTRQDVTYVINAASRYSPWAAQSLSRGYLHIEGGHRIGIGGEVTQGTAGFKQVDSLCIRIASDVDGIGRDYAHLPGSLLILGAPGWGKTTLLRDIARERAAHQTTVVIDERCELFPEGFRRGKRMDVLSRCTKHRGVMMALRTLGPEVIAVDEITEAEDTAALLHAANCGAALLATAHAVSLKDLQTREVYKPLLEHRLFQNILVLHRDQSCTRERMEP